MAVTVRVKSAQCYVIEYFLNPLPQYKERELAGTLIQLASFPRRRQSRAFIKFIFKMNILFVHQNFPGQYLQLARHLAAQPENRIVSISQRKDGNLRGVHKIVYRPQRGTTPNLHHYLTGVEAGILNAQEVARMAINLRKSGFIPDVMFGHNGWGEIWYLKDIFPNTPLIGYFEFFYRSHGADVGFDPSEPVSVDTSPRIRTKNVGNLLGLDAADFGQCPTHWQKSTYPEIYHPRLHVVHEGIDTGVAHPDSKAHLSLPEQGINLEAGDEIITYVARNLEPYRGFPSFMRSLPAILQTRPQAHILIVGGDELSYGAALPDGQNWRQKMLDELGHNMDMNRVHFLGKVPYKTFIKILQVSRVHVYLTYPFVLSWSMLEAMSAGCLLIGSRTAPVEEVIRDGENGLLVDFFKPGEIAERAIDALADPEAFQALRVNARQTIVDRYDLKQICLPEQLRFLEGVSAKCSLCANGRDAR
jgi:glycosyltransferase involved in cell wall biosynthesis